MVIRHNKSCGKVVLVVGLGLGLAWAWGSARAAEPVSLDDFDSWTAWALDESGARECGISAEPETSAPRLSASQRSDVAFILTHRPSTQVFYEPAMRAGYIFSPTSRPFVQIGAQRFQFETGVANGLGGEGRRWAWLADPDDAPRLVDAMRGGDAMIVKGRSSRETITTDRYDLKGVTQAIAAMDAACL